MRDDKPKYLKRNMKDKNRKLIVRYRCGNEVRVKDYWKEEEEKVCRVCKNGEESMWHILRECNWTKRKESLEEVLGEEGRGIEIIKEIERLRKENTNG